MVNLLPTTSLAQSILKRKFPPRRQAPPKIRPSKRAFEEYKPRGSIFGILRIFFKLMPVTFRQT